MNRHLVLHVTRAFSAQPTLGDLLGPRVRIQEMPEAEAMAGNLDPDIVWASDTTMDLIRPLRLRFPRARLIGTVPADGDPTEVVLLYAHGADLVLRDEGVLLAAATVASLLRRGTRSGDEPARI
jgi:hypothetical protein